MSLNKTIQITLRALDLRITANNIFNMVKLQFAGHDGELDYVWRRTA
jgi:hypothetical protein